MTDKKCIQCQQPIHYLATVCIFCGAKQTVPSKRSPVILQIVLLIVAVVLLRLLSGWEGGG